MSWLLPTPLRLVAAGAALLPLAFLLRRPTSALQLVAEAIGATRVVIAAVWAGWLAL